MPQKAPYIKVFAAEHSTADRNSNSKPTNSDTSDDRPYGDLSTERAMQLALMHAEVDKFANSDPFDLLDIENDVERLLVRSDYIYFSQLLRQQQKQQRSNQSTTSAGKQQRNESAARNRGGTESSERRQTMNALVNMNVYEANADRQARGKRLLQFYQQQAHNSSGGNALPIMQYDASQEPCLLDRPQSVLFAAYAKRVKFIMRQRQRWKRERATEGQRCCEELENVTSRHAQQCARKDNRELTTVGISDENRAFNEQLLKQQQQQR